MKKTNLILSCALLSAALSACNGSGSSTAGGDSTGNTGSGSAMADSNHNTSAPTATEATPMPSAKTPLNAKDSTFVMKAAAGGMMEVEAGKLAQQNGASDRVKAFGAMMVKDHSAAGQELATYASAHGLTVPSALPADMQKHIDDMSKMTGKNFDSHYVSMMVDDHKKDVAEFDKQSKSANDADLKTWAGKTLPTLKMHLDSIQAISKAKM